MDRIDFTHKVKSNVSIEQIVRYYFDEIMSLYDVLGEYNDFNIQGNFSDAITFNVKFKTKREALTLMKANSNPRTINIYDRQFNWSFEHNGKEILVNLV